MFFLFFFFFQAEDGIRDGRVTGVQTCALPIWSGLSVPKRRSDSAHVIRWNGRSSSRPIVSRQTVAIISSIRPNRNSRRSEERRVGKECRSRWSPDQEKRK